MLTYLLPSVVDISGAEKKKKGTVVINQKRLQNKKVKQTIENFNTASIFVIFCSEHLWSWNKTLSCYQ